MNRYTFMMLLFVGPLNVMAQRMDGCPTPDTPTSALNLSHEFVEDGLRKLGVAPTLTDLAAGLNSLSPDTRSLSALKLAETANSDMLALLLRTWLAEQDDCSKSIMRHAVTVVVRSLSYDRSLHPGGQRWVKPFLSCIPPADPHVTLRLEQVTLPGLGERAIRVVARNETQETIPFVGAQSPQELLSATVIGPTGEHAGMPIVMEQMYRPPQSTDGMLTVHGRVFVPLPPREEVLLWTWRVGDDFNMSEPGTYRVSLGGRMAYLGTNICSNTLEVSVGN